LKVKAKEILGYYEMKQHKPWLEELLDYETIRSKETSQIAIVTEYKPNKWG
jgi:hypothetical protein